MPFTKPLLIASLVVFPSSSLIGQINFAHHLYARLLFEGIEVRDSNNTVIPEDKLSRLFYRQDTAVNCFGDMVDRFYDLQYIDPQFVIWAYETEFDTLPHPGNASLIDVYEINRDNIGDLVDRNYRFSFDRALLKDLKTVKNPTPPDARLINGQHGYWMIERIEQAGKAVYVDACLARYRLSFSPNGRFHQRYRGRGNQCAAKVALKQQSTRYWGDKIHHKLSMRHGQWTTRHQQLYLLDERAGVLKTIGYTLKNERLVLYYRDTYRVVLKRAESRR